MLDIAAIPDEQLALGMITVPRTGKRGRRRRLSGMTNEAGIQTTVDALTETALGAATSKLVDKLRKQGLIKPDPVGCEGGGGHRTRNCRPVQVNMSEKMFRQLKVISATQGLSVKEQIIQALLQQGYTE